MNQNRRQDALHRLLAGVGCLALAVALACAPSSEDLLEEARLLQEAGEYERSLEALHQLQAEEPNHPEANYLEGRALVRIGRYSQSTWALRKVPLKSEFGPDAGALLAGTLVVTQNHDEAIKVAGEVLAAYPENRGARDARARANLELGHIEKVLLDAEAMVSVDARDEAGLALLGESLIRLEEFDKAERAIKTLAEVAVEEPSGTSLPSCLAYPRFLGVVRKDVDAAERELSRCMDALGNRGPILKGAVDLLDQVTTPDKANTLLEEILDREPTRPDVLALLGSRFAEQGRPEEAREAAGALAGMAVAHNEWIAVAQIRQRLGDTVEAIEAFEKALEQAPSNDSARFLLADLLISSNMDEQASTLVEQFREPIYLAMIQGRLALEKGDAARALAALEAGLREWPNNDGARLLAAHAALELGQLTTAESHLREAVRITRHQGDSALLLARHYLATGRPQAAVDQIASYLSRHKVFEPENLSPVDGESLPVRPEAYVVRARALTALRRFEEAHAALKELERWPQMKATAIVENARILEKRASAGAALARLEKSESEIDFADPSSTIVVRSLLEFDLRLNPPAEVAARFGTLADSYPAAAEVQALLGLALIEAGDLAGARAALTRAQEIDPADPTGLLGRALLDRREGNLDESVRLLEQASDLDGANPTLEYQLVRTLRQAGRESEAEHILRALAAAHPDYAPAANDLAWLLASRGEQLDFALSLAERASRELELVDTRDTLGFVQFRRGELTEARSTFEANLAQHPEYSTGRYHLALVIASQGDDEAALAELRRALAGEPFPEMNDAAAELARLEALNGR